VDETILAHWSDQGGDVAYRFDMSPDSHFVRIRSTPTRRVVLLQYWQRQLAAQQ